MNTKERIIKLTNDSIRSWSAKEMAAACDVSYSTARTILINLYYSGQLKRMVMPRQTANGKRNEFIYFRTKRGNI